MDNSQTPQRTQKHPFLGFGLGLRKDHYQDFIDAPQPVDWLEILTENYLVPGGKPLYYLDQISEKYPMVMHGVSLSIGGSDPIDWDYVKQVKALSERVDSKWISDHLCWTGLNQTNMHDLLPLPYTDEAIAHVAGRIKEVQDFLGRPLLLENLSSYVTYEHSQMSEWEFYSYIVHEADALMLLDINNIFVSSFNHGFDPIEYINGISPERVQQFHLAGHLNLGDIIVDTHDHDVIEDVWQLYSKALERFGPISTMIERDANIPPLKDLLMELEQAKQIAHDVLTNEQLEVSV